MAEADIIQALRAHLLADTNVAAEVGAHVYGDALPRAAVAAMPQAALVIELSGGVSLAAGTWSQHDTQRVDVIAWGTTPERAAHLAALARRSLAAIRRQLIGSVLVHWAEPAGGASKARDPDGRWAIVRRPYQIFHATEEAA